jgi:hypothetical protein
MRKRYRVLIFASLVAALVVPVGYALSVESVPAARRARYAQVVPAASPSTGAIAAAAVAAPRTVTIADETSAVTSLGRASDAAELFGIGSLLFGLAAFLRKAI